MSEFEMVRDMYRKFGLVPGGATPALVDPETAKFRVAALREEVNELEEAYACGDLAMVADALVDIVVFALGTAVLHRLPWGELFFEVHRTNMQKVRGAGVKARGAGPDLLKPPGWAPPDLRSILERAGWTDRRE